jgi:hypothetical protein
MQRNHKWLVVPIQGSAGQFNFVCAQSCTVNASGTALFGEPKPIVVMDFDHGWLGGFSLSFFDATLQWLPYWCIAIRQPALGEPYASEKRCHVSVKETSVSPSIEMWLSS